MKYIIFTLFFVYLFTSCQKEKWFEGPDSYEDGFENYLVKEDMLEGDNEFWSFHQLTEGENQISIDTQIVHLGEKSVKFQGIRSIDGNISKSSMVKQKMAFWEGETVRLRAWYYLANEEDLHWLFIMDLEEQATISAGPGMRLAIVDNQLRIEYKFLEDDLTQTIGSAINFPRNQWVEIEWQVKLSQNDEGMTSLWQDGQLIIEEQGIRTLPKDLLYFQQGTKGMYSSCEFGVTANSTEHDIVLWVDDISVDIVD